MTEISKKILESFGKKDWMMIVRLAEMISYERDVTGNTLAAIGIAYGKCEHWQEAVSFLHAALRKGTEYRWDVYAVLCTAEEEIGHPIKAYRYLCRMLYFRGNPRRYPLEPKDILLRKAMLASKLGHVKAAAKIYRNELLPMVTSRKEKCVTYSNWLLTLHYREINDRELFSYHKGYTNLFRGVTPYRHIPKRKEKYRIGYISSDFQYHVMFRFYFALIVLYDRSRYEVYGYSLNGKVDGVTDFIRNNMTVLREMPGSSYEDIAKQIYEDEIDILVDLAGHTSGSGLPVMAWKPSPIQVTALGYMGTSGLSTVDYVITDGFIDPPEKEGDQLVEIPIRLTSQFCYVGSGDHPSTGAPFLKKGYLLLGCFNQYKKMTDAVLCTWRDILKECSKARLLLKTVEFENDGVRNFAKKRLERLGFPMDRVYLEPGSFSYMDRYLDVDIALDTYPYVGGGTTCDALYMGVPVVSLYGTRRGSRFGLSILQNAGLGELAVSSYEEYKHCVLALARDPDLLDMLHKKLRGMVSRSPLMNPENYVREWERFFEQAIWTWQETILY